MQIADRTLTVVEILRPGVVRLTLEGEPPFIASWDRPCEVLPRVKLLIDLRKSTGLWINLLLDAPKTIPIVILNHASEE